MIDALSEKVVVFPDLEPLSEPYVEVRVIEAGG